MSGRVLIIDDDGEAILSLVRALKSIGQRAEISAAAGQEEALAIFREKKAEAVLLDLCLVPSGGVESGLSLLRQMIEADPSSRILVLTGHSSIESGIKAMELGAANFIAKPANPAHLNVLINDAIQQAVIRRAWASLRLKTDADSINRLAGVSPQIQKVREAIRFAAATSQPVLITGETGTGKGVCARLIHDLSLRNKSPFVRSQPYFAGGGFVQSELFGHIRGAFTGADRDRVGLMAEAEDGTLFLDEIDEMPMDTQVTLLGVLQEKVFRRLGSNRDESARFRLVSASNADLSKRIEERRFREDLLHRIGHYRIHLPPLRDRRADIPIISSQILDRLRAEAQIQVFRISAGANAILGRENWPGNVRELEARLETAAYRAHFAGRREIYEKDVDAPEPQARSTRTFSALVDDYKSSLIKDALLKYSGNQTQAAAALGLDRSSLRRMIRRSSVLGQKGSNLI